MPAPFQPPELSHLFCDLADSAVGIQNQLDQKHAESLRLVAEADLKPAGDPLVAHLERLVGGSALQATRTTFSLRIELARHRGISAQLQAVPLNLFYAAAFETTSTAASRLDLEIRAVPFVLSSCLKP